VKSQKVVLHSGYIIKGNTIASGAIFERERKEEKRGERERERERDREREMYSSGM